MAGKNLATQSATDDVSDILLYEKAKHLCSSSGTAAVVNTSIAVILYISLPASRSDWLWTILVASALRFGLFLWSKNTSKHIRRISLQYKVALAIIALQGTAWGGASLVLYSSLSVSHRFYLIAVLAGLTGGSILTLAPSFAAFSAFVTPSLCPLLIVFIFSSTDIFRNIGFMGFVYVLAIHIVARKINNSAIDQVSSHKKLERAYKELNTYKNDLEEIVSERTRDLKLSEERYRDSFEKAVVGMAVMGPESEFIRTNPAFQDMLGYSENELAKKAFSGVIVSKDRCLWNEQFRNAVDGRSSDVILETRCLKKSGDIAEAMVSFRIVRDVDGSPLHFIAQIQDISERKRIERDQILLNEKLRQSQKMEAVGTLAGGIAHDFNNILAAILGYAELARLRLADRPKEQQPLDEVVKAANRAKNLVQQILVFSHKREEKRGPIKIDVVVKEALNLIRQTIPSTIPIHVALDPQIGTIQADPTQIHQVVINLCTNAYHAVRDTHGEIEVRLKPVEIDPQLSKQNPGLRFGTYAQLTIKDTGAGMTPSVRSRVFEPFFTTKKQGEGTGMGLAVVYGIIQSHKGFIEVESEVGVGTTFRVSFPLLIGVESEVPDTRESLPRGSERILFVDDESMLARLGKITLETLGYQATSTSSANEALEMFSRNPDGYDLIISDQSMPGMSGAQLAQELMHIRPDIPIVLCTGYSDSVDADKAKALGVKAFLQKPIEQKTLAVTIREILDPAPLDSSL